MNSSFNLNRDNTKLKIPNSSLAQSVKHLTWDKAPLGSITLFAINFPEWSLHLLTNFWLQFTLICWDIWDQGRAILDA